MRLRPREIVGILAVAIGLIFVPAAWAFSRAIWLVAFFHISAGAWLFYTERNLRKAAELVRLSGPGSCQGSGRPTGINDYTGWSRAGRSETMDASGGSDGAEGD